MQMNEITNLLFKKLYNSKLDVDVELSIDDTANNAVQIQINVKPKYFNDFAIFYGTKDRVINFSSIFEVDNIDHLRAQNLFDKKDHIFSNLIKEDNNTIHLFKEILVEDFKEEIIDEIIEFLNKDSEITNYLISLKTRKGNLNEA